MDSWPERALHTLTVYFERGVKALELLREGLLDEADAVLNKRKAAFHNFRAADFLAVQQGYPESVWQKLLELWKKIEPLDRDLLEALMVAKMNMETQLAQVSKVKATLRRFKGAEVVESKMIEKSV